MQSYGDYFLTLLFSGSIYVCIKLNMSIWEIFYAFVLYNIATYCHNAVERDFDTPARLHFSRQIGGNFRKYLYITNPPIAYTPCQVWL